MKGFITDEEAKQNTGMALVVPSDKIVEILSSDFVKAFIARFVAHDKLANGDLNGAEGKFKESIDILERRSPEGSQLMVTLRDYGAMLNQAKRDREARAVLSKARMIAEQHVSKQPEP